MRRSCWRHGGRYVRHYYQRARNWSAAVFLLISLPTQAQTESVPRFDSYSDHGGVGLLQMPSARFAPEGEFAISVGRVTPYLRTAVSMQALPWLEGVVRYTSIQNRLYGPESFSGQQKYKDRAIDVKFELLKESQYVPQLALGFRDIGGTGLFSAEYLVASKRYYDFDFSLGLGWRYLGSRGQLSNPFDSIFSRFKNRRDGRTRAGNLSNEFFHGKRMSIIGGVIYQTPIEGLTLKLELDGNRYAKEPLGNSFKTASPINFGFTYAYNKWLDISFGIERGNKMMLQFVVHNNLHKGFGMPKLDAPPEPVQPRDLSQLIAANRTNAAAIPSEKLVSDALSAKGYKVDSVEISDRQITVEASQNTFRNNARAIGRAARIMANNAPKEVEELNYVNLESGLETQRVSLLRKDLEKATRYEGSAEEMAQHARISGPLSGPLTKPAEMPSRYPFVNWSWSPGMKHQIGGPDSPYFYQLLLSGRGELQLTRRLSATAGAILNVTDNLQGLKLVSDSVLPHVRSDVKEYLKQGKTSLSQLHADYLTNLSPNWYGRASVGIFEEMFGGVSGEVLYRPYDQRWAVGLELNRVRQRAYSQRFAFRDYRANTGHLDLYYRFPFYGMSAQLSVGQYLAGDRGATLAVFKRFDSGVVIGAFATKTNVSSAQFGEGSFDKGVSISIPMDLLSLHSSRGKAGMTWRPLTRDGGQRVIMPKRLYPIISDSSSERLMDDWGQVLQ